MEVEFGSDGGGQAEFGVVGGGEGGVGRVVVVAVVVGGFGIGLGGCDDGEV